MPSHFNNKKCLRISTTKNAFAFQQQKMPSHFNNKKKHYTMRHLINCCFEGGDETLPIGINKPKLIAFL